MKLVLVSFFLMSSMAIAFDGPEKKSAFKCPSMPGLSNMSMNSILYFDPDGRVLWRQRFEVFAGGGHTTRLDKYVKLTANGNALVLDWNDQAQFKATYIHHDQKLEQTLNIPFLGGLCKRIE